MHKLKIGVLSFQGGVIEHILATQKAAVALSVDCEVHEVKRKGEFSTLDALILPGGESTVMAKLISANNLWDEIKSVKNIFGTCAGSIMLAKKVVGQEAGGQRFLELMDIEADRNAYGSQVDSFEQAVITEFGSINAVFIRAPKIKPLSGNCNVLAKLPSGEPIAISETSGSNFYLAVSFHPELSTTKFHEYFIRNVIKTK